MPHLDADSLVTRVAPAWAWATIDETLSMDARSNAFDKDLRKEIKKAINAMKDQS